MMFYKRKKIYIKMLDNKNSLYNNLFKFMIELQIKQNKLTKNQIL